MTKQGESASRKIAIWALCVSIVFSLANLGYQVYHDHRNEVSVDSKITGIRASVRILTQTVAPQIYESIRDTLERAKNEPAAAAENTLIAVKEAITDLNRQRVKPDRKAVPALSQIKSNLVTLNNAQPNLPSFWPTSAELISYETSGFTDVSKSELCMGNGGHVAPEPVQTRPGNVMPAIDEVVLDNCTFVIDDIDAFTNSIDGKSLQHALNKLGPGTILVLYLHNVHVIYRGGKIPPQISTIVFDHCFLDFQLRERPPTPRGLTMVEALLQAPDLGERTSISLPSQGE